MWNSLPSSVVSSKTIEELRLRFRLLVQRYVSQHASAQLLVNSFNGPSRMFFPLAKFKFMELCFSYSLVSGELTVIVSLSV